jgi:hypothetical protein
MRSYRKGGDAMTIKTWQERRAESPDHTDYFVMTEEIRELREELAFEGSMRYGLTGMRKLLDAEIDALKAENKEAKRLCEAWKKEAVELLIDRDARPTLMDEQIWQIAAQCTVGGDLHADKFARAIEASIKNGGLT